ncbi:hypothetical protein CYG68_20835 [Morganella morganii]|uniref:Adhesin yadA n=1 Tax=Morganella morganii TaxID=582 RepID=A0A8I0Q0J0_MORMO|nr:YadA-like family protein [Morganella morganii]MBE8614777.1 hypothetical protein [Morganella morganii]
MNAMGYNSLVFLLLSQPFLATAVTTLGTSAGVGSKNILDGVMIGTNAGLNFDGTDSKTSTPLFIGSYAGESSSGYDAIGIGPDSYKRVSGNNNIAIGQGAFSMPVGTKKIPDVGNLSIVIGKGAQWGVNKDVSNSVIIGSRATVFGKEATAIGSYSKANYAGSIALGNRSETNKENSVSFGSDNIKRTVTNIASGIDETDAVNVSQLNKLKNDVTILINNEDERTLQRSIGHTDNEIKNEARSREQGDKRVLQQSVNYTDGKFNNLNSKLDKLDNKIDRGLASTAAISGLFQPYGIGKFNLTAGVGGYRSESAIAIGSGYRFNENIAAKAALSSAINDSSSIIYNASVNFEW